MSGVDAEHDATGRVLSLLDLLAQEHDLEQEALAIAVLGRLRKRGDGE